MQYIFVSAFLCAMLLDSHTAGLSMPGTLRPAKPGGTHAQSSPPEDWEKPLMLGGELHVDVRELIADAAPQVLRMLELASPDGDGRLNYGTVPPQPCSCQQEKYEQYTLCKEAVEQAEGVWSLGINADQNRFCQYMQSVHHKGAIYTCDASRNLTVDHRSMQTACKSHKQDTLPFSSLLEKAAPASAIVKIDVSGNEFAILDGLNSRHFGRIGQLLIKYYFTSVCPSKVQVDSAIRVLKKMRQNLVVTSSIATYATHRCRFGDATLPKVLTVSYAAPTVCTGVFRNTTLLLGKDMEIFSDNDGSVGGRNNHTKSPESSSQDSGMENDHSSWQRQQPTISLCSSKTHRMRDAVRNMCHANRAELLKAWLEPRFQRNYKRIYGRLGWAREAYVNFYAARNKDALFARETELLIDSVHRFSEKPIVVFDFTPFGCAEPSWTPERYPRLIVFHARPMQPGVRFSYNKLRAMLMAQVEVGVMLDSDEFVFRGADTLFSRTRQEGGPSYPYPILPVHWMSRDPEGHDYDAYDFKCKDCPARTMRWGHAHPTWTYHALPFIGGLLSGELLIPQHVPHTRVRALEDEDAFNVGLWATNATKQWCKFDVPFPSLYLDYISQNAKSLSGCCKYQDMKWYPRGVPLLFYTAHGAKSPDETIRVMDALEKLGQKLPSQIFFDGVFYNTSAYPKQQFNCLI